MAGEEPGRTDRDGDAAEPDRLITTPRVLGVGAAVAAVVVVGGVIVLGNQAPPQPLSEPAPSVVAATEAPSSTPAAAVYDARSGRVSVLGFSASVPGDPYRATSSLHPLPPVLASGADAYALVQAKYDGTHDWAAAMATGQLDHAMVDGDDATKTARRTYTAWVRMNFTNERTEVGTITFSPVTLSGADHAEIAQGRVSYSVQGVRSHYDQVSVLVVKLTDGPWVAWLSSRPEKASAEVKDALEASIKSIKVQ